MLLGSGRWDAIATGLFAGIALPFAMAVLIVGAGATWSVATFILLYGLASGALAVARALRFSPILAAIPFWGWRSYVRAPLS